MRRITNIITGFIFALAPFLGVTTLGFFFYTSFPHTIGVIIFGILVILSIWIGLNIFKKVQIIGPFEFLTAIHASPELDHLEPTKESETKRRNSEEIVERLKNNENLFNGGAIRIYGDWIGKPYENFHNLKTAEFNNELNLLTLFFEENEKLEIYNPRNIFEAITFFKVIDADRIKFTWYNGKNQYFYDYKPSNNKILTETNADEDKPLFDVSLGEPALMIYGRR